MLLCHWLTTLMSLRYDAIVEEGASQLALAY